MTNEVKSKLPKTLIEKYELDKKNYGIRMEPIIEIISGKQTLYYETKMSHSEVEVPTRPSQKMSLHLREYRIDNYA